MIYAKCIHDEQVAHSAEEFSARSTEERAVYCENQVTRSRNGFDTLYCVPLNFIYDCLKYGNCLAIIDVENYEEYPKCSSYLSWQIAMKEQKVLKILDAYSKEGIDYVFDHVSDPSLIHSGYVHWLPQELRDYFTKRVQGL